MFNIFLVEIDLAVVVIIFFFVYFLHWMCSLINYLKIIFVISAENTLVQMYILLSVKKIFYDTEEEWWENEEYPYPYNEEENYKYNTCNYHYNFWNLVDIEIVDRKRNVDIVVQIFFPKEKEDQDEEED